MFLIAENKKTLKNYILFHEQSIHLDNSVIYNKDYLFCQNKGNQCYLRQINRGETYLGCLKDVFPDKHHTIAYWYTDYRCKFFRGLHQLLKNKPSKNFLFKITHENKLLVKKRIQGTIQFYLHKDYFLDLFEQDTVPLIMRQFMRVDNFSLKEVFKQSTPLDSNKLRVENKLKVNLFTHQRDNIYWMKNSDRSLFYDKKSYSVKYIKSINEYILYDNNYKIYRIDESKKIKFKGGIICDEVGLGKTLTTFGYINLTAKNLILVPSRLVKQWVSEFYKYFGKIDYPIIPFTSVRSLPKLKTFTKGIIVCPITIFTSPKYNSELALTSFDRIFIDEAHEVLFKYPKQKVKEKIIYDNLFLLKSKEKWLLTATPFAKGKFQNGKTYFKFLTGKDLFGDDSYIDYIISKIPYRLNTKESIKKELQLPDVIHEKIYLKMTPIERTLYNAARGNLEKQVQLCTHFQVSEEDENILGNKLMTEEQVKDKLVKRYQFRLKSSKKSYEKYIKLQEKEQNKDSLEIKEKIDELKININTLTSRINIIKNLDTKQECSICFDEIDEASVTLCGHIFCTSCLEYVFSEKNKFNCPMCRTDLQKGDIYDINIDEKEDIKKAKNEYGTKISYVMDIISKNPQSRFIIFSQWDKMFKLISQVFDENKIKYVNLKGNVHKIANSIRKFKVDDEIKVIMLSSDKANSGCNLTEANHIIFLDNYHLTKDTMKQAIGRSHRIGQTKNIKVTRLIMENTIEDKPDILEKSNVVNL